MAQRIRRETTNLEIAGSNPVGDTYLLIFVRAYIYTSLVLWCNWLSLWTLNPAIRVQIPVGPLLFIQSNDTLAEWLRRVIRNHMGFPRAGSNPAGVAFGFWFGAGRAPGPGRARL